MVAKHVFLACLLSWVVNVAPTPRVFAQIINTPLPANSKRVTRATGNFDKNELSGGVKQTGWPSIPWPTITMPKFTMPTMTMPKLPSLWPSKSEDGSPALLSPFVAGYAKVSAGAKKTWEGTKDLFSVFQPTKDSQTISRVRSQPKASFWQRLTTRTKEPKAPQTVGEFMRQPRLSP